MPLLDSEIIEELTGSAPLENWIFIDECPCIADKGKIYEMVIEDIEIDGKIVEGEFYFAIVAFLKRAGARQYRSKQDYENNWLIFGNCPEWGKP